MVNYFEDDDRKYIPSASPSRGNTAKVKRHLSRVLNQISLEFSPTPLSKCVKSPQFVRDLDWIDHMWNPARKMAGDYPRVQYYCLTSTNGCFTDFHVDFGGTSVWYNILSGKKVFLLVPPTKQNLALYEKWLCRKDQGDIFFPDMRGVMPVEENGDNLNDAESGNSDQELVGVEDCVKIILEKGQTFIIPTGWIHAVYTPVDSLVIGGNFLHGFDIKGQLDVHCVETRTRVPAKFRFPSFVQMYFYAGAEYFKRLMNPAKYGEIRKEELDGLSHLVTALRSWKIGPGGDANRYGSVAYVESQIVQDLGTLYGVLDMNEMLNSIEDRLTLRKNGLVDVRSIKGKISGNQSVSPKIKFSMKRKVPNLVEHSEQNKGDEFIPNPPKSKLKLKLGEAMATSRAVQNIGFDHAKEEDDDDDEFPEMKILLKKESVPLPSSVQAGNNSSAISDLVSIHSHVVGDDEWLPDETGVIGGTSNTLIQKSNSIGPKKKLAKKKVLSKVKAQGNSRSRLLKKFKF